MRKNVDDLIGEHEQLQDDYHQYMNAYEVHIGRLLDGLKSIHQVALVAIAVVIAAAMLLATGLVSMENNLLRWLVIGCFAIGTLGEFFSKRLSKRYGTSQGKLPKSFAAHLEQALKPSNQLRAELTNKINSQRTITQGEILKIAEDALNDLSNLASKIDWILDEEDERIKNERLAYAQAPTSGQAD